MATTLADVARRSGVSIATASRVLNNKMVMPIPPATVERIKQAARELEYRPNLVARALATGKTHTLGLYSVEMTDPHFAQMLEAVETKARARGYHLIVSSSLDSVSRRGRVDGTLILGSPNNPEFAALPDRLPTIFVFSDRQPRPNLVAWNDVEGVFRGTKHLLDLGHRQIVGLFCYGEETTPPHSKVTGYRQAMQEAGAEPIECWEVSQPDQIAHGSQFENGYRAVRKLLREGRKLTAIVARNDFLALGALRALREAGRPVPQSVSVVGYTDSIHALCADPPLTSVRTPIAEAGEIAVERLIGSIDSGETHCRGTLLPTSLTIRQSCAPPAADYWKMGVMGY